jgi:hypothetical protein
MTESEKVITGKSFANQLRRLADFYDKHPETTLPGHDIVFLDAWVDEKQELTQFARNARNIKKTYGEGWIEFDYKIGDNLHLRMNISRAKVCQLVETGEVEVIPEHVVPATTRPKTKWVCDDPAFLPPSDEPAAGGR